MQAHSRCFVSLLAGLYAVLGAIMFVAPAWSSANFAWNVSPFVAMTIGGWCLGNGWAALVIARRWTFPLVASGLVYLALFGVFETAVAVAFHDKLRFGHWLGWLYVGTLAVNVVAAAVWLLDYLVSRPPLAGLGRPYRRLDAALTVAFILLVGFLGLYGLLALAGSRGLGGGIFPEMLSAFSLRGFGAFYLALALSPLVLLVARGLDNALSHMFLSWGLLLFITLAAFANIDVFDFAARRGQLFYIGTYLVVAAVTGFYLLRHGTGTRAR